MKQGEAHYDVAVIGGGSAGYAAARTTSSAGLRTVVVEGGAEVGGLCILRGCMPTKALLYSAEVMHLAKNSHVFGIWSQKVEADFPALMARKNRLIGEFADYRRKQLTSGKFEFIRANASFLNEKEVALSTGEKISADHFVMATGSKIAPSPLSHLDEVGYITSDEALTLERLPKSLIVLGGGAVAVEFAQFFARVGVRVTLIQRGSHILREADEDAARVIEKVFRREEMTVFTGTHIANAWKENGLKWVCFEYEGQAINVAAEEILFALGRVPNTSNMGLEKTGVTIEYGRFLTNSKMQTTVPHIYAAGDCTGLYEIVHIAIQQGEIAAHNIIHPHDQKAIDYRLYTSVVFTDPPLAHVGLTEKEAKERKIPVLTATYPFNDHGKSLIMEALDGFVKLLADPATGEIMGAACVGPLAGELIHEIVAAMYKRMTVHELAAMPHYHPTLAEIWTYPAEELASQINLRFPDLSNLSADPHA
jgi:pyruvate/2-oxoglutarate dehydrogenase complex dihydrolipoamide dehydrogenase (E3) component